jgi:tetratricopeptide (TPR) repeat protein
LFPDGWFAYGTVAWKDKDLEKAVDAFTRSVQIDPENGEAWNNIACLYAHFSYLFSSLLCPDFIYSPQSFSKFSSVPVILFHLENFKSPDQPNFAEFFFIYLRVIYLFISL